MRNQGNQGKAGDMIHGSRGEWIQEWIAQARSGDWRTRRRAVEQLGQHGGEEAREPLLTALSDPDPSVRATAATALGNLEVPEALEPLTERALEDPRWEVRFAAVGALAKFGDAALGVIIRALGDEDYWVRWQAVTALGQNGSERVIPLLVRQLREHRWRIREAAACALGKLRATEAVKPLLGLLRRDEEVMVQVAAAQALGEIGAPAAVGPLNRALNGESHRLRAAARQALERIGTPGAQAVLEKFDQRHRP